MQYCLSHSSEKYLNNHARKEWRKETDLLMHCYPPHMHTGSCYKNKSKMLYSVCPETFTFVDARHQQMGQQISQQCCCNDKHIVRRTRDTSILLGVLETQRWNDHVTLSPSLSLSYTHTHTQSMMNTVTCWTDTDARGKMHYIILFAIIKMLMLQQLQWHLCETGSVTPTAIVQAGHLQTMRWPANKGVTNAAVLWQPRWSHITWELGLPQTRVLEACLHDQLGSYHIS